MNQETQLIKFFEANPDKKKYLNVVINSRTSKDWRNFCRMKVASYLRIRIGELSLTAPAIREIVCGA